MSLNMVRKVDQACRNLDLPVSKEVGYEGRWQCWAPHRVSWWVGSP
jgi:hypothetical protein